MISRQNKQSIELDRKLNRLHILLQNASKDSNYHKVIEIIDQRLKDEKPLQVAAHVAMMETLKKIRMDLTYSCYSNIDDSKRLVLI